MMRPRILFDSLLASGALLAAPGLAQTQWTFDLFTDGDDAFWTSPTAVTTQAPQYELSYEIQVLEVEVRYIGITFGPFDVTDQIPPEFLIGGDVFDGPPPIVVLDDTLLFPPPPDTPTSMADVRVELRGDGFGSASATNVTLGTFQFDLGSPFGTVTVQLVSVALHGVISVTPLLPGDLDGDGDVDLSDLAAMLSAFGLCSGDPGYDAAADLDAGGCVDLSDLAGLLSNFGIVL